MSDCSQIESLLPPFVDGEAEPATVRVVEGHLADCPTCRALVHAQRTARTVLRARAAALRHVAPPGLRTRVVAALENRAALESRPWPFALAALSRARQVSAFAAAVIVVLMVASALELVTPRSNVLYAAQLAVDHVRCFVVELAAREPPDARALQQKLERDYGWAVRVPPSDPEAGLTLVAARRCPFWIGDHAHLLYRQGNREVSLYVTPGGGARDGDLHVLGHDETLWAHGDTLYTLVADDLDAGELARVRAYFQRHTLTN